MDRVVAVCVKNPFDPLTSREIREYAPGKSIRELFEDFYPDGSGDYDVEIALDGRRIDDPGKYDLVPLPGTSVAFCAVPAGGEGKNPLAIVAALALIVAVPALVGSLPIIMSAGMSAVVSTGMYIAGGLLIQAIFPMSIPDSAGANQLSNSSTYSWDPQGNLIAEGGALPEIFGVHRVTPPVIARFVTAIGDKMYLHMLFAVAGHPLDSISSVRINKTEVEKFQDVVVDVRLGSADQSIIGTVYKSDPSGDLRIEGFEKIRTEVPVGAKLQWNIDPTLGWTERITQGNIVDGIGITIGFPRGLYSFSGTGAIENVSVKIWMEYRLKTPQNTGAWKRVEVPNTVTLTITEERWSGGYWDYGEGVYPAAWVEVTPGTTTQGDHPYPDGEEYIITKDYYGESYNLSGWWRWISVGEIKEVGTTSVDYIEINEAAANPIYRSFYPLNALTPGQYEIRCRLVDEPTDSIRWVQDVYLTSLQEIVSVAQTYPGVSLLGIRALATDQLSGSDITVDCLAFRAAVPIYNGAVLEYRLANNPAWACYYLLNRGGEGVDASRMDYQKFSDWSNRCQSRGYEVNLYVDSTGSLRRVLDMVSLNGRASVVQMGSKFTPLVDLPEEISTQRFLFSMGNIAADSFSEEWMPTGDRANAIEVTYWDKGLEYDRQTVEIYSDDFDTSPMEINKVSVTLYGCTSKDLATKYGRFLLACNRYLTLTSAWDADVDAIGCIPNDMIDVAHDVPQWGESGRIVSYSWVTLYIVLDRVVTMQPGTNYIIMIRRTEDDAIDTFAADAVVVETTSNTFIARMTQSIGPPGEDVLDGAIVTETEDGAIVTDTDDGAMVGSAASSTYAGAVYSFGTVANIVKQMRVLRISRASDLRKKLTCIEYASEIYVDGANGTY
jgi:hypothetical protein